MTRPYSRKKRHWRNNPRTVSIVEAVKAGGRSFSDIARVFGVTGEYVRQCAINYAEITGKENSRTLAPTLGEQKQQAVEKRKRRGPQKWNS